MKNVIKCVGVVLALWILLAVVWVGTNAGIVFATAQAVEVKPVHIPVYRCLDRFCNRVGTKDLNT